MARCSLLRPAGRFIAASALLVILTGCGGDSSRPTGPTSTSVPQSPGATPTAEAEAPAEAPAAVELAARRAKQNPVIRSFRLVRLDRATWVIGLDTFDPQADLWQGTCHAAIQQITNPANAGQFHIPINTLLPGANPADPEANVFCAVRFARPAPPGVPFRFTVMVTDRQGNNSNKIRGSVITEGRKDSGQSDDDLTFAGATAEMRP